MSENIPDAAIPAWNAYLDMEKSKQAHFNLLAKLESNYQQHGSRTLAENASLENLLSEHDECVQCFRRLTKELQTTDLYAYQALIEQITLINADRGPGGQPS